MATKLTCFIILNIIVLMLMTTYGVHARVVTTQPQQLLDKVHVILINNLTIEVGVDCKSKNDDLGEHQLAYQASYEFRFRPNLFGKTLFFCRFELGQETRHFDVYVESRDKDRCMTCRWLIGSDGLCLFNPNTALFDICSNWNTNLEGKWIGN